MSRRLPSNSFKITAGAVILGYSLLPLPTSQLSKMGASSSERFMIDMDLGI